MNKIEEQMNDFSVIFRRSSSSMDESMNESMKEQTKPIVLLQLQIHFQHDLENDLPKIDV